MGSIDIPDTIIRNHRATIALTTSDGTAIPTDTDMTTMHVLTTAEALGATLEWYLSWDKTLDIELVNIRFAVSAEVAITSYNLYYFALNKWNKVDPYTGSLTGTQALAGMTTAYPLSEDVLAGAKLKYVIVTAGACTVGVAANGRL